MANTPFRVPPERLTFKMIAIILKVTSSAFVVEGARHTQLETPGAPP
jgi:hypothetical protein